MNKPRVFKEQVTFTLFRWVCDYRSHIPRCDFYDTWEEAVKAAYEFYQVKAQ